MDVVLSSSPHNKFGATYDVLRRRRPDEKSRSRHRDSLHNFLKTEMVVQKNERVSMAECESYAASSSWCEVCSPLCPNLRPSRALFTTKSPHLDQFSAGAERVPNLNFARLIDGHDERLARIRSSAERAPLHPLSL